MKKIVLFKCFVAICMAFICVLLYSRRPIVSGKISGQTVFLTFCHLFHRKDVEPMSTFILIDDDSGPGIEQIHDICERVGVKAIFAVVPAFLDSARCDSLKKWQEEGYGIAIHGYNHGPWKDWNTEEVKSDIVKSLNFLENHNFKNIENINLVVVPSFYNTKAIRDAVSSMDMKMVLGGNVVNPDTIVSQWGRVFITKNTDVDKIIDVMRETKKRKYSIVFGTHSSSVDEFSPEKTETILNAAKEIFKNLHNSE